MRFLTVVAILAFSGTFQAAVAAEGFSVRDAILQAVQTNPGVGEAAANRRATEAYVDVVRYTRLIALSQENVQAHRKIFNNVNSRYQGGRAGEGDLQQARERVAAAEAALAEFRRSLDDARSKYRKTVGIEPF